MNIRVYTTIDGLAQAAADMFLCIAEDALDKRGRFTVALSGGRTPKLLFDCLTKQAGIRELPWSRCYFFWVDERYVPVTDSASNFKMAQESLLAPLQIPESNVFHMPTHVDLDTAVAQYGQTLRDFFSLSPNEVPQFDLIQLGMGPDGHTASLFPQSFDPNDERLVAWTVPPAAPHHRITLTPRVLQAGVNIMVLLTGQDKAKMLKTVLTAQPDVIAYPVQLLRAVDEKVTWLLDDAAASELDQGIIEGGLDCP